jgi:DNA-directed RNA polymerase sigma subunit (sigma70/sigma32)
MEVRKIEMKQTHAGQAHLTLNEIADMLDLTRERVRQIEAKAIMKLRKKMQLKGIKPSDLLSS